jgi:two-component system, NarL family, response regulator LiaR
MQNISELTEREREVLQCLAGGLTYSEIADQLVVSRSTVKFHVCNVLGKLGANNRTTAVLIGLRRSLITNEVVDLLEDADGTQN